MPGTDIFDEVAAKDTGDIFDQVAEKTPQERDFENRVTSAAAATVPRPSFMRWRPGAGVRANELAPLPEPLQEKNVPPPTGKDYAAAALNTLTSPAPISTVPQVGTEAVQGATNLFTPGQRKRGAAELIGAAGEAATPLMGIAALTNPVGAVKAVATGAATSYAAKKATAALGGDEQAQELAEQAGFWFPTAFGLMRPRLGIGITPEEVVIRGGAQPPGMEPRVGEVRIPRGPRPSAGPANGLEPPTIDATPQSPDMVADAAGALARANLLESQASAVTKGIPITQPPPTPPPVHGVGVADVAKVGEIIANLPEAERPAAIVETHGTLSRMLLQQGKVVGPDGQLEIIDSPKAADRVAQKWINDEVVRRDKLAKEAAKAKAKAEEAQPVGEVIPPGEYESGALESIKAKLRQEYPGASEETIQKAASTTLKAHESTAALAAQFNQARGPSKVEQVIATRAARKQQPPLEVVKEEPPVPEETGNQPELAEPPLHEVVAEEEPQPLAEPEAKPAGRPFAEPEPPKFSVGDRVTMPDGQGAKIDFLHPKMAIARVQTDAGKKVSIGTEKLKPSEPEVKSEPVTPEQGAGEKGAQPETTPAGAKDGNTASIKGKKFWIGIADARDGFIEKTYTHEQAEAADFHHSHYFGREAIDKLNEGDAHIFWVEPDGRIQFWDGSNHAPAPTEALQSKLRARIKEQLDSESHPAPAKGAEPSEKPAHEMTPEEFRATSKALSVPKSSILALGPKEYTPESLSKWGNDQLKMIARLWGVSQSGNKSQLVERIIARQQFRGRLSKETADTLSGKSNDELHRLAAEAGIYHSGSNKQTLVDSLLGWLKSQRENAKSVISSAHHESLVRTAAQSGKKVPQSNLDEYGLDAQGKYEPTILDLPISKFAARAPELFAAARRLTKGQFEAWLQENPRAVDQITLIRPGLGDSAAPIVWEQVQQANREKAGGELFTAAEKPEPQFKHGSTQANIAPESEAGKALETARARISESDLAGKGKDVGGNHVTVRYGLDDKHDAVREYLKQQAPFEATLGKTASFPPSESRDGAAVLQAPIESPDLTRINEEIAKHGKFAESNFKEYRPHATIAYVHPDKVGRYTGMNVTEGKTFTVDQIAITDREGQQEMVKLEGKGATPGKEPTLAEEEKIAGFPGPDFETKNFEVVRVGGGKYGVRRRGEKTASYGTRTSLGAAAEAMHRAQSSEDSRQVPEEEYPIPGGFKKGEFVYYEGRRVRIERNATMTFRPIWPPNAASTRHEGVEIRHHDGAISVARPEQLSREPQEKTPKPVTPQIVPEKKPAPGPKLQEGDRVSWEGQRGSRLTGTIRSIDAARGTAEIDTDQIVSLGGRIPIGRIETVKLDHLQWEGSPPKGEIVSKDDQLETIKDELRRNYPGNSDEKIDKAAREQLGFNNAAEQREAENIQAQIFRKEAPPTEIQLQKEAAKQIKTRQPHVVVRDVRDDQSNYLATLTEPYSGTAHSALEAAKKLEARMFEYYPEASNIESRIGATDSEGKPRWAMSPNLKHVADVGTEEARYIWGDTSAERALPLTGGAILEGEKEREGEPRNQPARPTRQAEGLPGLPEPESQGAHPPVEVSAEGKPETQEQLPTGQGARPANRERVQHTEGLPGEGNEPARSGGSSTPEHPAAEREGRGATGTRATGADGKPVESPAPQEPEEAITTAKELRNQRNYRISDEEAQEIGSGGEITKIKGNLDALETLKNIQKEGREIATPEEQQTLSKYVDFGGLVGMLQNHWKPEYAKHYERFQNLLTKEEIQDIRETLPNTHFTSMQMVDWMWKAMGRMAFRGGRVGEFGMGIGNFVGRMPEKVSNRSEIIGVERNPLTGSMARLLYPDAKIAVKPFQEFQVPNDSFDAVIGNVPFQDVDITNDPPYAKLKLNLHNYFIVKSLDKIRPGGLLTVITSRYTMDNTTGKGQRAREEMAKRADLLLALRLPDAAFKRTAGTEVVADLLIFRKRDPNVSLEKMPDWTTTAPITVAGEKPVTKSAYGREYVENAGRTEPKEFIVNRYFIDNPTHVLGEHSQEGNMYGPGQYTVKATPEEFTKHLETAAELIPERAYGKVKGQRAAPAANAAPPTLDPEALQFAPEDVKPGAYFRNNKGEVFVKESGIAKPVKLGFTQMRHMRQAIDLRDQLNRTIQLQLETSDDEPLKEEQKKLESLYGKYRKEFGSLHGPALAKAFGDDPEYPKLLALENFDPETKTVSKAKIFTERVLAPYEPLRDLPEEPKAAMLKVMAERGYLDTQLMAELLKKAESELVDSLEKERLIFQDPQTAKYHTADEYLSGNVREKLKLAERAADTDKRFQANVEALREAQPTPLTIHEIQPSLGQTWIPIPIYESFVRHLAKNRGDVTISRDASGKWLVQVDTNLNRFHLANEWAGGGIEGHKLVQYALNQQLPTVRKREGETVVFDPVGTAAARDKLAAIKEEFRTLLRSAPENVVKQLETIYNDTFNGFRLREFSGEHLDFPGMNQEWNSKIRGYQKAAVWRIVQEGRGGIFHAPGLGKTLTMVAAGMEARRLKLSRKNFYAVPNHMIPQWREDFKRFYPNANVLAVTDDDFSAQNRAKLMSRIALGDWDAVIIPHSQFDLLPMSPKWESQTIEKRLADYREVLEDLDEKEDRRTIKQIEKAVDKLEARLHELNAKKKDNTIHFDELGIDMLFVDEAHLYKSMAVPTRMGNIGGISNSASQRAFALEMKADYMRETHKGRGVVFGTGTPITNTVGELYVMTKYLAPEMLEATGIRSFDDWAANFATAVTQFEYGPDGVTFKPKTTLSEFVNVPELSTMFRRFGEYLSKDDAVKLANLQIPEAQRKDVTVKITPTQEPLLDHIAQRGDRLTKHPPRTKEERQEDNWLKLSGDARKISLDPRLYDPDLRDDPGSKANEAVKVIVDVLERSKENKGTIVVFSDFFQHKNPGGKPDFNLFEDMRKKLVKAGVPREQVAIIHEAESKDAKEELFAKVRAGRVRLLFGSTDKMGIGTNIQDRLKAEIHLDQPWRPDQVEQREGRLVRSGNQWKQVEIYRFIAEPEEGTRKVRVVKGYKTDENGKDTPIIETEEQPRPRAYDLQMYQSLARKAMFQEQFLSGNYTGRTMEDTGGEVRLNSQMFQLAKAMASGNPDALRKVKVEHDLNTYNLLQRNFQIQRSKQLSQQDYLKYRIPLLEAKIKLLDRDAAIWEENENKERELQVGDVVRRGEDLKEWMKGDPNILQLIGKKIVFRGLETELKLREGMKLEYELAGEEHVVPVDDRTGTTHVSAFLNSFSLRAGNLAKRSETEKTELQSNRSDLAELGKEIAKPSPYAAKVEGMEKELAEINQRMGLTTKPEDEGLAEEVGGESEAPAKKEEKEPGVVERLIKEESGSFEPAKLGEAAGALVTKDLTPALKRAGIGLRDTAGLFVRAFYPRIEESNPFGRMLGLAAPTDAVDALMKLQGERAREMQEFDFVMKAAEQAFDRLPEAARIDFTTRIQTGEKQPDDDLQELADAIKAIQNAQRNEEERAINLERSGQQVSLARKENYFHNRWAVKPSGDNRELEEGDEQQRIARLYTPRRPLEGSRSFNKRQFYTLREGIEAGGQPVTTNPIRMLRLRLEDGMKLVTARRAWYELRELGLRKFVRPGQRPPEGFDKIDDRIAKVYFPAELDFGGEEPVKVPHQIGEWYVEANTARLLNNMLSRDRIRESAPGRGLMWLKNASTALELGLSPFHAVFETIEAASSAASVGLTRAINQGLRQGDLGEFQRGLTEILTSPVAPLTMAHEGAGLRAYVDAHARLREIGGTQYGKTISGDQPHGVKEALRQFNELRRQKAVRSLLKRYPDLDQLVQDMWDGGLVMGQHRDYHVRMLGKTMQEAFTEGNPLGGVLRAIPTGLQGIMKPLFEWYIPSLKYSLFLRMMSQAAAERADELEAGTLTRPQLARQVADSVENRFGEMNFDNLFLNRSVKTGLQFLFRSVTWKLGSVREFAGAGGGQSRELGRWAWDAYQSLGGSGGGGKEPPKGKGGKAAGEEGPRPIGERLLPRLDPRMSWVVSLVMYSVLVGSIAARLLSGRWPWEWTEEEAEDKAKDTYDYFASIWKETMHPRTGETDSRGEPSRISLPTYVKEIEHARRDPRRWLMGSLSTIVSKAKDIAQNEDYFGNYVYNPNASLGTQAKQIAKFAFPVPFVASSYVRGSETGGHKTAVLGSFGFPKAPSDLDWTPAEKLTHDILQAKRAPHTPEENEAWRQKQEDLKSGNVTRKEARRWVKDQRLTWLQRDFKNGQLSYFDKVRIWNAANEEEKDALAVQMRRARRNMREAHRTAEIEAAEAQQ
jgi:N12 class adenine-specific DNA methylase/2'-5' RNA ligase